MRKRKSFYTLEELPTEQTMRSHSEVKMHAVLLAANTFFYIMLHSRERTSHTVPQWEDMFVESLKDWIEDTYCVRIMGYTMEATKLPRQ